MSREGGGMVPCTEEKIIIGAGHIAPPHCMYYILLIISPHKVRHPKHRQVMGTTLLYVI